MKSLVTTFLIGFLLTTSQYSITPAQAVFEQPLDQPNPSPRSYLVKSKYQIRGNNMLSEVDDGYIYKINCNNESSIQSLYENPNILDIAEDTEVLIQPFNGLASIKRREKRLGRLGRKRVRDRLLSNEVGLSAELQKVKDQFRVLDDTYQPINDGKDVTNNDNDDENVEDDEYDEDDYVDAEDAEDDINSEAINGVNNHEDLWGLDQLDGTVDYEYSYDYNGDNTYAFVIDSGILQNKEEFGNRLQQGTSFVLDDNDPNNDCNGHGTHVSGTIGSKTYGVAKNVKLVPVRVFGCIGSTSWSTIISAMDWVRNYVNSEGIKRCVVNMSLSGQSNSIVLDSVKKLSEKCLVVVAAGNANTDACNYSPSNSEDAMTVGAFAIDKTQPLFSNYGPCVDINAPGVDILSIYRNNVPTKLRGTSMASPHIAGIAALVWDQYPKYTQYEVYDEIIERAEKDSLFLREGKDTPNLSGRTKKSLKPPSPTPPPAPSPVPSPPTPSPSPPAPSPKPSPSPPTPSPVPTKDCWRVKNRKNCNKYPDTCKWYGKRYKCRGIDYCGFKSRAHCIKNGCTWSNQQCS